MGTFESSLTLHGDQSFSEWQARCFWPSSTFWIGLEAVLVDLARLNLGFQRLTGNAQFRRSASGSKHALAVLFRRSLSSPVPGVFEEVPFPPCDFAQSAWTANT